MWQDLQLAARSLIERPGFAAAAIATLALGMGASTAIISVAYGVSLRPLPYPEPNRLIRIYEANPASGKLREDVSIATFQAWREGVPSLEAAALFGKPGTRVLAAPGRHGVTAVTMVSVSPAFFDVLGARPLLGSGFKPEKDYTRSTAADEIVLSYSAWQRLFGGERDAVGTLLEFTGSGDNDIYRVIGIMPETFAFGAPVDGWRPSKIVELPVPKVVRTWRYDGVVARLAPGVTLDRARAELDTVAARLAQEFPASSGGWTITVDSLHQSVVGAFGRTAWLLLAAMAMVLLVTCLNVGGLLTARVVARERETAVRVALGAAHWRLLRLWITEASLLSALGAGLGLLLAWSGVSALKAAAPPGIPRLDAVALDLPTLAIAGAASLVAIVLFTLAPLARSSGMGEARDLTDRLRAGPSGGYAAGRRHTRTALTVAQCAGAATLVVLAVMLTRTFVKLMAFDLGWNPAGVLSLNVAPPMPRALGRPWARYVEWSDRLVARLESTPGIQRAAITTQVPLSPQFWASTIGRGRGKADTDTTRRTGVTHNVSDHYFQLMGMRLTAGRTFGQEDRFNEQQLNDSAMRPERGVAIVSESTARMFWPGQSAIGQALWLPDVDTVKWREVVGVVEDTQFHAVGESPALHVYVPWTQFTSGRPRLVVKANGDAAAVAAVVRDVVQAVERGTHVDQMVALDTLVARATAQPRFTSRVVTGFGALALLLAAVGIYGTLSSLVGARTREIGIRLALGAPAGGIISDVVWRGIAPAVAGGILGLGLAVALARTFRALLFGVEPLDLASFAGGGLLLLLVAVVAALGPALRASRVDPIQALRVE
jgi:predicted permease